MQQVQNLCDKVVYLKNGSILKYGKPTSVVSKYLADSSNQEIKNEAISNVTDKAQFTFSNAAEIKNFDLTNRFKKSTSSFKFNEDMSIVIQYTINDKKLKKIILIAYIVDVYGNLIQRFDSKKLLFGEVLKENIIDNKMTLTFKFKNKLRAGKYFFNVYLDKVDNNNNTEQVCYIEYAKEFDVLLDSKSTNQFGYIHDNYEILKS